MSLRVGATICYPHRCRCGQQIDSQGLHGLSCIKSAGRIPRHAEINNIIKRSLAAAGIPSILEPSGLNPSNSTRPDGVTIYPFTNGKTLCWDATVSDTFSKTAVNDSAISPGAAANKAEDRKIHHYSELTDRHIFTPISFETPGAYGKITDKFFL